MISQLGIHATGHYLWAILKSEHKVKYSRFYNDLADTADALINGAIQFIDKDDEDILEYLQEEGHVMLEYAAWQLEDFGVVKITRLTDKLVDDDFDFLIELTPAGQQMPINGLLYSFHGAEHSIVATTASQWLIEFLDGCDNRQTLTLREVMEYGDSHGYIKIEDSYFANAYGIETGSYIWAFEVSLWHHAKEGNIQPICKDNAQRWLWVNMICRTNRPDRPSPNIYNPLWDVPFRLSSGLDTRKMNHVGSIS